jgi:hypothetical protein
LDIVDHNANALTLTINDRRDMSRIVSGSMRLGLRPVELDACQSKWYWIWRRRRHGSAPIRRACCRTCGIFCMNAAKFAPPRGLRMSALGRKRTTLIPRPFFGELSQHVDGPFRQERGIDLLGN